MRERTDIKYGIKNIHGVKCIKQIQYKFMPLDVIFCLCLEMLPREARRQVPVPRSPAQITYSELRVFLPSAASRGVGRRARDPRTPGFSTPGSSGSLRPCSLITLQHAQCGRPERHRRGNVPARRWENALPASAAVAARPSATAVSAPAPTPRRP